MQETGTVDLTANPRRWLSKSLLIEPSVPKAQGTRPSTLGLLGAKAALQNS
jgi:hypothetical protein